MRRDLEHQHQKALVTWARFQSAGMPALRMLHATPNGGLRTKSEAGRLKAEGVKAGYPDLSLDVAVPPYHGLRIEMKVGSGRLSTEQRLWLRALADQGYCAVVAFGWEAARDAILCYLRGGFSGSEVQTVRAA